MGAQSVASKHVNQCIEENQCAMRDNRQAQEDLAKTLKRLRETEKLLKTLQNQSGSGASSIPPDGVNFMNSEERRENDYNITLAESEKLRTKLIAS